MFDKIRKIGYMAVALVFALLSIANPAMAVDLLAAAKTTIKDTAGQGSGVENALLALGAIGALAFGFMSKNWIGAIGGFAVGLVFWNVAAPLAGL